jgi:DNA-binding GntR family transcriptional regulator
MGKSQTDKRDNPVSKDLIYKELRRSIIMGYLNQGSRLSIKNIADKFNTSITPVRDALQMLSQEGLVTIKPRSGYYVSALTLKELRDLLDLRCILELAAIEKATLRISPEQIEELRNVHEEYTGEDDASYARYTEENRQFHYLIAVASGNLALAEALGKLHDRLARFMVMQRFGPRQVYMHNLLIDALEKRDPNEAYQIMLNEVNLSRDAVLDSVMEGDEEKLRVVG